MVRAAAAGTILGVGLCHTVRSVHKLGGVAQLFDGARAACLPTVCSCLCVGVQMPESNEDLSTVTEYPLTFALTMAGALFVLGLELVRPFADLRNAACYPVPPSHALYAGHHEGARGVKKPQNKNSQNKKRRLALIHPPGVALHQLGTAIASRTRSCAR
jgi:hypothetical protein